MLSLPTQPEYIFVVANLLVTVVLIGYSIYLYSIERNLRKKFNSVNGKAENIIEEANKKALEIINKSKFISESMKEHFERGFEAVIHDLKHENKKFYEGLEKAYFNNSERFTEAIKQETEKDVKDFSNKLAETSTHAKTDLEKKLEGDYEEAKQDIQKFKELKKKEFETALKEKLASISANTLPGYLKVEDQEKFVKEVIEKASSEGFFN